MTINLPETTDKSAATEPASRAQMLRHVADAIDAGLPEPMHVNLNKYSTGNLGVELRLEDNAAAGVAAWANHMGIEVKVSAPLKTLGRPWRDTGAEGTTWHGWTFHVWSAVDETEGGAS